MPQHSIVHWSLPRGAKRRAEVRAEQALACYGTPSAAHAATGIPLEALEAAEARINQAAAS